MRAVMYGRLVRELCGQAIDVALGSGAGYADARAVTRRVQNVATKNGEVESVSDGETEGIGVRVLVDGAWGFACDRRLSDAGAREAAGPPSPSRGQALGGPVDARSGSRLRP